MERYSSAAAVIPHEEAMTVPPQNYLVHELLHSVRKSPVKPWKKPTALHPRTPPRSTRSSPLTSENSSRSSRGLRLGRHPPTRQLQEAAPPPLELVTLNLVCGNSNNSNAPKATTPLSAVYWELMSEGLEKKFPHKFGDGFELSLSPSFLGWSMIPMSSPGTLSRF